jgi:SAM-dependent methyltransferase
MTKSSSPVSTQQAYNGSDLYFQVLRACGWGSLLNLGYSRPWDTLIYPFRADIAQERLVQRSISLVDVQPQHQVLDVACGKGRSSFLLAMQNPQANIIGLDKLAEHINIADFQYGYTLNLSYQAGEAEALPFADRTFDRIHCLEAAFHFDRQKFLQEASRVLKPAGRIVIVDFMWKTNASRQLLETPDGRIVKDIWQFDDLWSVDEYLTAIELTGFQVAQQIDWSIPEPIAAISA